MESPTARRRVRERGSIACRRCRQAKVRCGMSEPPCNRCEKHGFRCLFDPTYRRINTSDRFEQLENRLNGITGESGIGESASPYATLQEKTMSPQTRDASGEGQSPSQHDHSCPSSPRATNATPESYSIGSTNVPVNQIRTLFSIFFEHYHGFLPFLDESRTPDEYHTLSPALFWSIVAIASRQFKGNLELLTRLSSGLSNLIWTVVAARPMSLAHVQALLLMSSWPLPDFRWWTDRSLVLISTALVGAMHIGLHRPGREAEYSKMRLQISEAARLERTRTWIACVAESQKLSMIFGHLPLSYMNDYTIHHACQNNSKLKIPPELRRNLMIQRCSHRGLQKLTSNYDNPFGLPSQEDGTFIVDEIGQEFDALHASFQPDLSYTNTLQLYFAKLFFQCTHFLYDSMTAERMKGILDAFSTASLLLTTLISHPDSHSVVSYAPAKACHVISMASMVIFRVLNSSYATLASLDRSAGHVLYSAAAISVRQASVQYKENDLAIRMCEIMTKLWSWADDDAELRASPPKLLVKSRIGSSIVYDCLIIFRRYQLQRDPNLGELQTGETTGTDQPQQHPLGSGLGSEAPMTHTNPLSFRIDVNELPTEDSEIHVQLNNSQAWDLSSMAWVDNFEYPDLFGMESH